MSRVRRACRGRRRTVRSIGARSLRVIGVSLLLSALLGQLPSNAVLGWPTINGCSTQRRPTASSSVSLAIWNLELPTFASQLEQFARDPLFRGIRYGNLWGRDLSAKVGDPSFIADLKVLAEANLVLDTANPNPALINAVVRLSDRVPDLTVVLDHLPGMQMPA